MQILPYVFTNNPLVTLMSKVSKTTGNGRPMHSFGSPSPSKTQPTARECATWHGAAGQRWLEQPAVDSWQLARGSTKPPPARQRSEGYEHLPLSPPQ